MESEVDNEYIEKALRELISIYGIKQFIDQQALLSLIYAQKIEEAIASIARNLGLPIKINLKIVPQGYHAASKGGFNSTQLVKTDAMGKGKSAVTAQVSIPSNLPLYGSKDMVNFPISICLSENCLNNPSTLITVMAHELSHIVLYSTKHKDKDNEFYTDLTAMALGFANIMRTGRKVINRSTNQRLEGSSIVTSTTVLTTTYGYLSDENFNFAFNAISNILKSQRESQLLLREALQKAAQRLVDLKRLSHQFNQYLSYVGKNINQKFVHEDLVRIGQFHRPDFAESLNLFFLKKETELKGLHSTVVSLNGNYSEINLKLIEKAMSDLASTDLETRYISLESDLSILRKYVGILYKLRQLFKQAA